MERESAAAAEEDDGDETVSLDEFFFINTDYQLTTFTFGSEVLQLLCLQSASRKYNHGGHKDGLDLKPGKLLNPLQRQER
ncbi:hypothetical protein U1Q18_032425 [Sarracenia purpurea var. burkii]